MDKQMQQRLAAAVAEHNRLDDQLAREEYHTELLAARLARLERRVEHLRS